MWMLGQVFICTDRFGTAFFLNRSLKKLVKRTCCLLILMKLGKWAIMQIGIECI